MGVGRGPVARCSVWDMKGVVKYHFYPVYHVLYVFPETARREEGVKRRRRRRWIGQMYIFLYVSGNSCRALLVVSIVISFKM